MKKKLIMEGRVFEDDIKLMRQQILFKKPYGEVISFAVNQLGLTSPEAIALYDELAVECHESWKGVQNGCDLND